MNLSDSSATGPVELLYAGAEKVLQITQQAVAVDKLSDFVDSVRWKEPFIIALLLFQVLLFALMYKTRKNDIVQFSILFFITALTLAAEKLNELGREHWPRFAKQNYFDKSGLFMVTFVSGPFVIMANYIVLNMGLRLMKLYGRKKRRQLMQERQAAEASGEQGAGSKKDN